MANAITVVISSRFWGVSSVAEGAFSPRRRRVIYTCLRRAVVKAGCKPPVGLGLDDGAARTAAVPRWNRTPAQGVLTAHFMVAARTCLRHKKLGSIRSFTFSTGDNRRSALIAYFGLEKARRHNGMLCR